MYFGVSFTLWLNSQLGLAVPGVSGKKKYASIAIGSEMTPFMTVNTSVH